MLLGMVQVTDLFQTFPPLLIFFGLTKTETVAKTTSWVPKPLLGRKNWVTKELCSWGHSLRRGGRGGLRGLTYYTEGTFLNKSVYPTTVFSTKTRIFRVNLNLIG